MPAPEATARPAPGFHGLHPTRPRRGRCGRAAAPVHLPRPARTAHALLLAGALALAACTGGESRGAAGRSGPGATARGGAETRHGGTLSIALLAPRSLDPAYATRPQEQLLVANLFDSLTAIDRGGAVQPAAAASWTRDPTLRHWRFQLRPDGRYADGTPVGAADFQRAWERLASPRTTPRPATPAALLDAIDGYQAFASGHARHIAGLSAPDPTTLLVDLAGPLADLPAVLASPRLSPLPAAGAAGGGGGRAGAFGARPLGNGPFTLAARYAGGRPFDLVPSPAYAGARPDLDRVRVVAVPDEQTAWLALQHNQVSFAPVPLDQVAAARALEGLSADGRGQPGLLQGPETATWSLGFSLHAGPAKDPRWRQAVSLAIDRQRIATDLAGALSAATGIVPSGVPGAGQVACPPCGHDPARARALLAQVGKAGRGPVQLAVPATARDRRIASRIADDLRQVGVTVQVVEAEPGDDPDDRARDPAKPPAMLALVQTGPYPRMDAFLQRQFSSRGAGNPTGFADPAVDRLLTQARASADQATRTRLYQQAEQAVLAALPVAPILQQRHSDALAPGIQGFDLTPWDALDLSTVKLAGPQAASPK